LLSTIILMDLRLIGLLASQPLQPFVGLMQRLAVVAFAGAAVTGAALFSIRATEYAFNPAFQAKLALIALAGLNLAVFARAGHKNPRAARLQAALSIVLWVGVLIAGRFIGFL
jgi:hypothetical protein